MKHFVNILAALSITLPSFSVLADVNLYGPGGPHTALIKVGEAFQTETGIRVNVHFGPQASWNDKAKENADILFGASEQSALAIATDHAEHFDIHNITPLYLRPAIILVKKGNPKNIQGLTDLAKSGIGIVVADGAGTSNTSGTGVWEDMIGRTGDINIVADFRKNIVLFTPNSGGARKAFLEDSKVDAWVTWLDWAKSNPDFGDVITIEKDLVVYRDINVVLKNNPSKDTLRFSTYLKGDKAKEIFQQFGWSDKIAL
ncbi:MAG: substrate-binding domain-containing protein [Aeromonas sp.]|uniref:substrate-binding domain-containing protein n=1 Tax=Aeromonas sp. TaxID=647 RepID=UPI002FC7247E